MSNHSKFQRYLQFCYIPGVKQSCFYGPFVAPAGVSLSFSVCLPETATIIIPSRLALCYDQQDPRAAVVLGFGNIVNTPDGEHIIRCLSDQGPLQQLSALDIAEQLQALIPNARPRRKSARKRSDEYGYIFYYDPNSSRSLWATVGQGQISCSCLWGGGADGQYRLLNRAGTDMTCEAPIQEGDTVVVDEGCLLNLDDYQAEHLFNVLGESLKTLSPHHTNREINLAKYLRERNLTSMYDYGTLVTLHRNTSNTAKRTLC